MTLLQEKDLIVGAGFLINDEGKSSTTQYFIASFHDDDTTVPVTKGGLNADISSSISSMSVAMGNDGELFLTGIIGDDGFIACAMNVNSGLRYSTFIPRKKIQNNRGPSHYTLTDGSRAVTVMPDNEENLKAYQAGGKLRDNKSGENAVIIVTFDDHGKPSYELLRPEDLQVTYMSFDRTDRGRTMIFDSERKIELGRLQPVKIFWRL